MTSSSAADRRGPTDPETEQLPRSGPRLAPPEGKPEVADPTGGHGPQDPAPGPGEDTGPVGLRGERPAPPPPRRTPFVEPPGVVAEQPPAESDVPPGRAGRNLGAAVGVGVALAVVVVASLLVYRPAFLAVVGLAVLVAVYEISRALEAGGFRPPLVPLLIGSVVMGGLAWTRGPTGLVVGFLVTALAVLLWRLADGPANYLHDAGSGVLVALYVPLLAGFAVLMLVPADGATRVLIFIVTVVCSDIGGYAAGVLFGKHPMAPSVSPKKSWEGMAGSVAACVLVATPVLVFALDGPWWGGLVFGTALACSATFGDLAESLIKRDLGIKDMGHLLPGHGGIMDRLDSLLPSAAVAYLLLSVLAPV